MINLIKLSFCMFVHEESSVTCKPLVLSVTEAVMSDIVSFLHFTSKSSAADRQTYWGGWKIDGGVHG